MNTKFIKTIDFLMSGITSFIITTVVLAAIGFYGAPILAPYCAAAGLVVMEYWTSRAVQREVAGEWEQVYRNYPYSGFDEDGKYSFNNDIIDI